MKTRLVITLAFVIACIGLLPRPLAAADLATLYLETEVSEDGVLALFWKRSEVRPVPGPPKGECHRYVIPCPDETDRKKPRGAKTAPGDWMIHAELHGNLESRLTKPADARGAVIWIEGPAGGKLKSTDFEAREKDWSLAISEAISLKNGDEMRQFWSIDLGKAIPEKAQVVPIVRPGRKGCWVEVPCD